MADRVTFKEGDRVRFFGKKVGASDPEWLIGRIKKISTMWVGTNKHGSSRRQVPSAWIDSPAGGTWHRQLSRIGHAEAIDALGALVDDEN